MDTYLSGRGARRPHSRTKTEAGPQRIGAAPIIRHIAFLDTCVLAPMPVADTLLRLAEGRASYIPKWSPDILQELNRTLTGRFRCSQAQADRRIGEMKREFPDAMVTGYESLIAAMTNDPKDRHVLAAAVKCRAHVIVSDNVKHFPKASVADYKLKCLTADDFLAQQYQVNPDALLDVLVKQAVDNGCTLRQLLSKHVPSLSTLIIAR